MSKSIKPALEEIEAMYQYIVDKILAPKYEYTINDLKKRGHQAMPLAPVFLIQQQGRRKTLSWYTPRTWESLTSSAVAAMAGNANARPKLAEITISTELLTKPKEVILDELLVSAFPHWHTFYYGYYHNAIYTKALSDRMNMMGLYVENEGGIGFRKITGRAPRIEAIWTDYKFNNPQAFKLVRDHDTVVKRTGSPLKKWSCGCTIIRATRQYIHIKCNDCGNWFIYADHDALEFHKVTLHSYVDNSGACVYCGGAQSDAVHTLNNSGRRARLYGG